MRIGGALTAVPVLLLFAASHFACSDTARVSLLEPGASTGNGNPTDPPPDGPAPEPTRPVTEQTLDELRDSACAEWTAESEIEQAVLMLVVDVSTSMRYVDPSGDGTTSKWQVTRPMLQGALSDLPPSVSAGLLLFPNMPTSQSSTPGSASDCVNVDALVPLAPLGGDGSTHRALIQDLLAETEPQSGAGTPTHDAFLAATLESARSDLSGRRYILLITDGQPTYSEACVGTGSAGDPVDVAPLLEDMAAAREAGIRTFVIGSPGSEQTIFLDTDARPWLSQAAAAGGTAAPGCSHQGPNYCHLDLVEQPDLATGLRDALVDVSERILECDFALPVPPPGEVLDPGRVNVMLTSESGEQLLVLRNDSTPCDGGWRFSENGDRIELCGDTCDLVRSETGPKLDLFFGCASILR